MDLGDFIHTMGDAHIYLNHVDALKEQIKRSPREFPQLIIKKEEPTKEATIDERLKMLESFRYEDIEVVGYNSHGKISMPMAV